MYRVEISIFSSGIANFLKKVYTNLATWTYFYMYPVEISIFSSEIAIFSKKKKTF